ncbi:Chromate resistance protein ChrB [Paeniglutamicibacter sp. R2-26]|uniref:Chromate resistance protein ChrB n=1 Tax=Paeniglutamicibacter sp. R2-26 TaxID=3144417 RepID=UPI003EE48233
MGKAARTSKADTTICTSFHVTIVTISGVTRDIEWIIVLPQVPSEPSRHRVAVWRQLRKAGAVAVSSGAWAVPAGPVFQADLERARELCHNGGGTLAIIDASPRDKESTSLIRDAYEAVRLDEWAEFIADCGKFEAEIAKEVRKQKFTFAELEEEEQSLERLRRWYRDLKKRDVLELAEAETANQRLRTCTALLDEYAEQVYQRAHGAPLHEASDRSRELGQAEATAQ